MQLAIDPGNDAGWALFHGGRLYSCGLTRDDCSFLFMKLSDVSIESVIIEHPVCYPRSPVPPNDIVKLAINAGQWGGAAMARDIPVQYVKPYEWKGKLSKEMHHAHMARKLAPVEQAVIDRLFAAKSGRSKLVPKSKQHNVLDAVGLGLFQAGR